jgi:dynein heavy chain
LTQLVRGQLTKIERKVIVALVTTDVHARDIISSMCEAQVSDIGSFLWQQQLRYYWLPDVVDVQVKQSNAVIPYGFEYQGAASRLVITPLTDRCWMTITGAWNLKLGAAPAGPAGTGKTESSKDLAKALGIQCIVFNCSEQIDYKMIGKLFAGLAQAGAWTCLDEFNRIDIEVLSVVAQQLQQLRQGKLAGLTSIQFEGRVISLKDHVVIITMNPGYAGRTELPDNLKIQFRPVAMMVPDYALIAEIILYAEGFDDAQNLSRKMVKLYKLSSEQLSQQRHYDFGMRAVKSVLVMAGALKRGNPGLSEDVVLIRAMRDSNVPKFLADDLPLFHAIVGDLFPGVVVPPQDFGALQEAILATLDNSGLQRVDKFTFKIIQLFETFNVRFGVVIVGPTGAGKSRCYQTLAGALTSLRQAEHEDERFRKSQHMC